MCNSFASAILQGWDWMPGIRSLTEESRRCARILKLVRTSGVSPNWKHDLISPRYIDRILNIHLLHVFTAIKTRVDNGWKTSDNYLLWFRYRYFYKLTLYTYIYYILLLSITKTKYSFYYTNTYSDMCNVKLTTTQVY